MALLPFVFSLKPNARADAALFTVDTTKMESGTYKIVRHPLIAESYSGFAWSVLLIKMNNNSSAAWLVPTRNGSVLMPDIHWWRPMFECHDFGPTIINGKVDVSSVFECHDKDVPEWWADKWRWDSNGRNYSGQIDNMKPAVGVVEGGFYVVGKSS